MNLPNSPDFPPYLGLTWNIRDNTLDDAQLERRCPLDNGRHDCTPTSTYPATSQLDKLPLELLTEVLLQLDIPSLTRFRSVSRRAMQAVNSVHQYSTIFKHCPNIIRAIVSAQANAFDCRELYRTLSTSRCTTCDHFGDYLYLIDCRRVCYSCYTNRAEYFPLITAEASTFFRSNPTLNPRKLLESANLPSFLSLPGRYCWTVNQKGYLSRKRLRLYDRQAVVQNRVGSGLPRSDRRTGEPRRFMAIISAPVLLDGGRQVDTGFFCLGCRDKWEGYTQLFRIRYTKADLPGHIARYGPVERRPDIPMRFMHIQVNNNQATP